MAFRRTTEEFISKVKEVHGNTYDLSGFEYIGQKYMTISCKKHGDFQKRTDTFLIGSGCNSCKEPKYFRVTIPEKIARLEQKYKVSYTFVKYLNKQKTEALVNCPQHGAFKLLNKTDKHKATISCSDCKDARKQINVSNGRAVQAKKCANSTDWFIAESCEKHSGFYTYSRSIYTARTARIIVTCPIHGDFSPTAAEHLTGRGCGNCWKDKRGNSTKGFIEKAVKRHGALYDYTQVIYTLPRNNIIIKCAKHGLFEIPAGKHLTKRGHCSMCVPPAPKNSYSLIAIEWIESYAYSHRLKNVQHAKNGGEYCLPGTRIRVDGFHARSNTVFEFHGSCFHGDPNIYKPRSKPNPFSDKTAYKLHKDTLAREEKIRSLGYNLIVMWESAYRFLV